MNYTAWRVSKYGVFSGPHFPAFGLNTDIYFVNIRIQSEFWKIRTRENSVFGHFSRRAIFTKSSIIDVWQTSNRASEVLTQKRTHCEVAHQIRKRKRDTLSVASDYVLTLFRMGFFEAAHGWEAKRTPSLKYVTHILQWWNLVQIYLSLPCLTVGGSKKMHQGGNYQHFLKWEGGGYFKVILWGIFSPNFAIKPTSHPLQLGREEYLKKILKTYKPREIPLEFR